MDLTPESVRGIEFRRKGRGYDAEEVDEFRAKVEIWVGELQARLREATTKLDEAETRARDAEERARTSTESDETIQRTLLLAQRTADAAVKEAEETAARKVAEAEAEAERLTGEARGHRERAIVEAEAEVREAIDLKRAELLDELTTLERARDTLSGDVGLLEGHLDAQHQRVAEVRDALGRLLDDPAALAPVAAPELSGVDVPQPEPVVAAVVEPVADLEPPAIEPVLAAPAISTESVAPAEMAEPGDHADEAWATWAAEGTETPSVFDPVPPADGGQPADVDAAAEGGTGWADPALAEPAERDPWADESWADVPPPPPPPPGLDEADDVWADAPPPPPPPPPPVEEPADATFGGLSGPAVPDLSEVSEDDNPWLAELSEEESGSRRDRSRFGRRR